MCKITHFKICVNDTLFVKLHIVCNIKAVSFTYPLENFTLDWFFYTTSGCDGCDKYEVCLASGCFRNTMQLQLNPCQCFNEDHCLAGSSAIGMLTLNMVVSLIISGDWIFEKNAFLIRSNLSHLTCRCFEKYNLECQHPRPSVKLVTMKRKAPSYLVFHSYH